MPISKRKLELGIDSEAEEWMRQAYHLLAENRDLAYSTWELHEAVLGTAPFPDAKSQKFAGVLDILAETGAADKGVVESTITSLDTRSTLKPGSATSPRCND